MRVLFAAMAAVSLSAQSIQTLTQQIQRAPTATLYIQRGTAYLEAGDAKQAVADYDRALERDAINLKALTQRAQAYFKLNRFPEVITDLSGAIALAPADARLFLARSEAYTAAGDARHAQEDRDEALRLDPTVVESAARAKLEQAGSGPKEAPATVASTAPAPLIRRVAPPPAKPKPVESPKPAEPSKPEEPVPAKPAGNEDANTHYQRGRDLIYKDKHVEGRAELIEAIRLDPNNAVLYNTLGFSYYTSRDYKRAIEQFDRALQLNPNYPNAMRNRALAKKGAGDNKGYEADHQRELQLAGKGKN